MQALSNRGLTQINFGSRHPQISTPKQPEQPTTPPDQAEINATLQNPEETSGDGATKKKKGSWTPLIFVGGALTFMAAACTGVVALIVHTAGEAKDCIAIHQDLNDGNISEVVNTDKLVEGKQPVATGFSEEGMLLVGPGAEEVRECTLGIETHNFKPNADGSKVYVDLLGGDTTIAYGDDNGRIFAHDRLVPDFASNLTGVEMPKDGEGFQQIGYVDANTGVIFDITGLPVGDINVRADAPEGDKPTLAEMAAIGAAIGDWDGPDSD